jgi:phage terminase large subunit
MTPHVVSLPNGWYTRPYQDDAWKYLASGGRRAVCVWHRRSGKDELALHWTATACMEKPATYWHMLPQANQARKAIWEAVNPHTGKRRIDEAFPHEIRSNTREQEMMIKFVNGATWQVVGSDNFNALVGSPPYGIVFSEYSLADPAAWDYLRPILAENGGWALFIYTARGKNHGYTLYRMAQRNPDWFSQRLTVDETKAISAKTIEDERNSGMSEDMIQQEYYCSFDAANPGAYYGKEMAQAWKEGRVCHVPVEQGVDCETWWDLGMDDSMSIWITQTVGRELRAINYIEHSGEGLGYYAKQLKNFAEEVGINYVRHVMPHDIEVRELGTGKSRKDVARGMGIKPIEVAPKLEIEDGIDAVRRTLPFCWFDEMRCAKGIAALTEYSKDWDEKGRVFALRPKHNWASHGADAFRTLGVTHRFQEIASAFGPRASHKAQTDYDPYNRD